MDGTIPTREWDGIDKLRRIIHEGNLNESALLLTQWLIEAFQDMSIPVHPQMRGIVEELKGKLNVDSKFFDRT